MNWREYRIGDFLIRSKEPVKINSNEDYTLVTIRMYHKGVVKRSEVKGSSIKSTTLYKVKKGQFILSGIDARNGAFGIVPEELDNSVITNDFWAHNIDSTIINVEFFYWFTTTPQFYDACIKASEGTTNRQRLQADRFYSFPVFLPSLDDQIQFVKKINSLKNKHEELNKELAQQQFYLQLLRQTIFQEAVQGKLTRQNESDEPASELLKRIKAEKQKLVKEGKLKNEKELPLITEDEIPFELPKGWTWCRLGDACEIIMGQSPDGNSYNERGNGIPLINGPMEFGGKNYFDKTLAVKYTTQPTKFCKKGDLLICVRGSTTGRTNIADFDACIGRGVAAIRPYFYDQYVYYSVIAGREKILSNSKGSTFPNFNQDQLLNLLLPLPPISEQQRIVAKVQRLQQQLNVLEIQVQQNVQYAAQLLQTILKETFAVRNNIVPFERKVFAGHVINMSYKDSYFGLVKFQKTLHVCEYHAQVEYETNYEQEVAGPYDRAFTLAFKKEMVEEDWFQQEMKVSLNRFVPGGNVGKLEKEFPKYFRNKGKEIRFVLQLFQGKSLEESELIATLYAVWNNRIIRNEPTDISVLIDDVYKWSERKSIYSPKEITAMHSWMIEKGLVPTGFGKEITRATSN